MNIDIYHHIKLDPEVRAILDRYHGLITSKLEKIMLDTSALVAAAQRAKKDNEDLLAVLTSVRDQNKANAAALEEVKKQLEAIPADTAAAEQAIASVVADLNKMADDTEAAVAGNPQIPDMPPAPPPA